LAKTLAQELVHGDSLSLFYAGVFLAWTGYLFISVLIFHFALGFRMTSIAVFAGIGFAVNSAVAPLLFYAHRNRNYARAFFAVSIMVSVTGTLWAEYLKCSWRTNDPNTQWFLTGFMAISILFGIGGMIAAGVISRRAAVS
jgi:hypothetical protein